MATAWQHSGGYKVGNESLKVFGNHFPYVWIFHTKSRTIQQMMASVSAVLATTNQFNQLKELVETMMAFEKLRFPEFQACATVLRWEFDESYTGVGDKMAEQFEYGCGYGGELGFQNAETKCLAINPHTDRQVLRLNFCTANGLVYPHRDANGKLKWAIRVRHPAAERLLSKEGFKADESLWLQPDILDNQLNLVRRRNPSL
ncbi:hypothetical protein H4R33_004079 [Dimargaris cristalligena]|nr:hypothetical protein H4R33_004079 [Dimargaris cristalligena]